MAARRLLIVMIALLVASTVAAALVPAPEQREATTATTTSPRTSPVPAGGELVRATLDAQAKRPQTIRLPLGDQLALTVRSDRTAQVGIPRLGLLEDVQPLAPARFNVLATRPGRYEIRRIGSPRPLGEIVISESGRRA